MPSTPTYISLAARPAPLFTVSLQTLQAAEEEVLGTAFEDDNATDQDANSSSAHAFFCVATGLGPCPPGWCVYYADAKGACGLKNTHDRPTHLQSSTNLFTPCRC